MLRLVVCFLFMANATHSQVATQYDRGAAILEVEQALFMMALKNQARDRTWDAESAAGLATLRQRAIGAGISESAYGHRIMNQDPATGIDAEVVTLSMEIWNFYKRIYFGRRGMVLLHDGPERIFLGLRNEAQSFLNRGTSPLDWCTESPGDPDVRFTTFAVELPFDASGPIDLRPLPTTGLNPVLYTMIVPYLTQHCPHALKPMQNYPQYTEIKLQVYIRDETLTHGVLRKRCENNLVDGFLQMTVKFDTDTDTDGALVAEPSRPVSAVGLEGVPDDVITRELMDEEERFAQRIDCARYDKDDGMAYFKQFKNRYGY